MRQTFIALAVATASAPALAQSSVTMFGVIDANVAFGRGSVADRTQLTSSGNASSRLGFRGTEDLGGGLAAGFWLEMGLNNDDGTGQASNTNNQPSGIGPSGPLTLNRRSTVSLSGHFGEVRVGRDYTPHFWNYATFDPFTYNGVGATQTARNLGGPTAARASNSVAYFTPRALGGFYGQLQHYLGENLNGSKNSKDGTGSSIRLGYLEGPLHVALATSYTRYYTTGSIRTTNLGASYDFDRLKVSAIYTQDKVADKLKGKGWLLGVNAPVGAGEYRVAYSSYKGTLADLDARSDKLAVGYVYNLSKRTAVYGTLAFVKNRDGGTMALNGAVAGPDTTSRGLDLGVRHAF